MDKYNNETLNDRESTHGDYEVTAHVSQSLKNTMHYYPGFHKMSRSQQESLDMICTKISRILSGDPDNKDHWDDIAGYANLISERLG